MKARDAISDKRRKFVPLAKAKMARGVHNDPTRTVGGLPKQTKAKVLGTESVELDMDHFVEYIMQNFPELTEMYVRENYNQKD
jgi:hypothetical protein